MNFKFSIAVVVTCFTFLQCNNAAKSDSTEKVNNHPKLASMQFADNNVVAHRGAWKKNELPQNSIASLKEAIRLGCTGSEFDVYMTADDSLVANHDKDYFGKVVETSTYQDLLEQKLPNGESIPSVQAYIEAGMENNTTTALVLEIKPSAAGKERGEYIAEKVIELVRKLNAEKYMMYISFDYDIVKKLAALDPKAKVAYLNGDKSPAELKADGIWGLDYHLSLFQKDASIVAQAKENNVNLNVWTVNKQEDMEWFINQKFDYITTDEPELLFEVNKAQ